VTALTSPTVRVKQPAKFKVTDSEREYVLRRDGCVGYQMSLRHICADQWGTSHGPFEYGRLTLEHVKEGLQMGLRAPSDRRHMVGACWKLNLQPPTHEQREWMRAYLESVEP
jgi:hypothetical protein